MNKARKFDAFFLVIKTQKFLGAGIHINDLGLQTHDHIRIDNVDKGALQSTALFRKDGFQFPIDFAQMQRGIIELLGFIFQEFLCRLPRTLFSGECSF